MPRFWVLIFSLCLEARPRGQSEYKVRAKAARLRTKVARLRVCIFTFALHFLLLSKNYDFCRNNSDFCRNNYYFCRNNKSKSKSKSKCNSKNHNIGALAFYAAGKRSATGLRANKQMLKQNNKINLLTFWLNSGHAYINTNNSVH